MSSTNWKTVTYIRVPLPEQNLRSQHLAISDEFIERASIVSSYRLSCIRIAGAITKPPPRNRGKPSVGRRTRRSGYRVLSTSMHRTFVRYGVHDRIVQNDRHGCTAPAGIQAKQARQAARSVPACRPTKHRNPLLKKRTSASDQNSHSSETSFFNIGSTKRSRAVARSVSNLSSPHS